MGIRPIAATELRVPPLCLGTMTFGTPVAEQDAIAVVHWALDHGLNFIDTANMYEGYARSIGSPGGVAEKIVGKALRGRREQAVLATKVGMKIGPGDDDEGLSRAHIRRECDRSLQRLTTDWIDLYYMHKPDESTPIAESIEAVAQLIQAGKVRHWGLSNFDADQVRQVLATCAAGGWPRPVVHQPAYSLLNRGIEQNLLPLCRDEGIAVVPYQVLQGGLLTGKYADPETPPEGSRGAEKPEWIPMLKDGEALSALARLRAQAEKNDPDLYDYVIRTTANTPGITSIILGVKRPAQLEQALRALGSMR
jgi:1-deoxyxylulose-5-phosphate synthase